MTNPGILFMPHGNLQYSQLSPDHRGWVARASYDKIFDLALSLPGAIAFEASGETLEILETEVPDVLAKLSAAVKAGKIEPVASPQTHIMLSNVAPEIGISSLIDGRDTWERLTGVRPTVGWNPECSWASYIPEIYKEAGFEALIADADSYLLSSVDGLREATGLKFDVRGHSNKNELFKIEPEIENHPEILKKLMRPLVLPNGLKVILRTDMMCNLLLWYLMGTTEGNREKPVSIGEVKEMLSRWQARIPPDGGFLMPYAEDAEYVGTTAYFFVKQFGQARFFEPSPESVDRFEEIMALAQDLGFDLITPSQALAQYEEVEGDGFERIENGCAWHGGTAKAWCNTVYARILDPVCSDLFSGVRVLADYKGLKAVRDDTGLHEILRAITSAYVSDARWPPVPTSPGRFNVREAIEALKCANQAIETWMRREGIDSQRALYSPPLMASQIAAAEEELMAMPYFEE